MLPAYLAYAGMIIATLLALFVMPRKPRTEYKPRYNANAKHNATRAPGIR